MDGKEIKLGVTRDAHFLYWSLAPPSGLLIGYSGRFTRIIHQGANRRFETRTLESD